MPVLKRLLIAAGISLFYVRMYPILIGGFVIYVYPYWSARAAVAWVLGPRKNRRMRQRSVCPQTAIRELIAPLADDRRDRLAALSQVL